MGLLHQQSNVATSGSYFELDSLVVSPDEMRSRIVRQVTWGGAQAADPTYAMAAAGEPQIVKCPHPGQQSWVQWKGWQNGRMK